MNTSRAIWVVLALALIVAVVALSGHDGSVREGEHTTHGLELERKAEQVASAERETQTWREIAAEHQPPAEGARVNEAREAAERAARAVPDPANERK